MRSSEQGFTLVEVVVAFVVAALVLVAALQLFGGAFDGSARAERLSRALVVAESRMSEIGVTLPLRTGQQRGETAEGLVWSSRIAPYDGLEADVLRRLPVRTFDVTISVGFEDGSRDAVTLRTLKIARESR